MDEIQKETIYTALLKAKQAMTAPKKNSTNPHFRSSYANLTAVMAAAIPALHEVGIVVEETIETKYVRYEGGETISPRKGINTDPALCMALVLVSDPHQSIKSRWPLIPEKKTPQGYGSALTYGRRYLLQTMCGLSAEDDDGNAASKPNARPAPQPTPQPDPVVVPNDGTKLVTMGHVMDVKTSSGKKANGTPWTRYGIKLDSGEWFNTFDKANGEKALAENGTGVVFEVYYTKSDCGKYNNLETLFAAGAQPDPAAENEQNNHQGDGRDDDIPF